MTDPLQDRNVIVLGLSRQGTLTAEWLAETVGAQVFASDVRPADQIGRALTELGGYDNIHFELGSHPLYLLNGAALVVVSNGVPLTIPFIVEAQKRGVPVTNTAQLVMERAPCDVIAVAGSAGKTTTIALASRMMEAAGLLPWIGGSTALIGDLPYIRREDLVLLEVSAASLPLLRTSPRISAVLNLEEELPVGPLLAGQVVGDIAVLNRDDPAVMALAARVQAEVVHFSDRVPVDVGAWRAGERILSRPAFDQPMEPVCAISEVQLRGAHNLANVLAACAIAGAAGVPPAAMRAAVLEFRGVAHRMQHIREWRGISFINDAAADSPRRARLTIETLGGPIVLIAGGSDHEQPWAALSSPHVRAIIGVGAAAGPLEAAGAPVTPAESFEAAFAAAAGMAFSGDTVLLAPGTPLPDYAGTGEHFRVMAERLSD